MAKNDLNTPIGVIDAVGGGVFDAIDAIGDFIFGTHSSDSDDDPPPQKHCTCRCRCTCDD